MRPASPGSVHSHKEGEEGYGDGQPDQRRETAGVAVACVQNHTPLAPRAGGADYGPAHTHHSRNQAGVRGSVSCGISPAWCVHVLIETNRDYFFCFGPLRGTPVDPREAFQHRSNTASTLRQHLFWPRCWYVSTPVLAQVLVHLKAKKCVGADV